MPEKEIAFFKSIFGKLYVIPLEILMNVAYRDYQVL
jgi:hypothetical protein